MTSMSFITRDTSLRLTAVQAVQGTTSATGGGDPGQHDLTSQEEKEVRRLKQRHQEVTRHEEAHYRTAGRYALGRPTYEYADAPDGKRYRVGGEVRIDTAEEADPEKTLEKAKVVKKAALAPADPSTQDRRIAAQADQMMRKAEQEIRRLEAEELQDRFQEQQVAFNARGTVERPPAEPVFIDTRV